MLVANVMVGCFHGPVDHVQPYVVMATKLVYNNAMMGILLIMMDVRLLAHLNHAMLAAHVMDGPNLGFPLKILAHLYVAMD